MSHDVDFNTGDAGSSATYPMQCSALRKNGHVVIKGRPCKIMETSTSKTGKHGHAKVHIVGIDIFTNKKYEDICPSTHNMDVPNVSRKEYSLVDIDQDNHLSLMGEDNEIREDLKLDDGSDISKQIKESFNSGNPLRVTVLKAMDDEAVISFKVDQE
ncbi:hypothetical protein ACOME3_003245 [Neoechinorhynchus agilis]